MKTFLLAAVAAITLATGAHADAANGVYGVADVPKLLSSRNDLKFERDYEGKPFEGTLTFNHASKGWFSEDYVVGLSDSVQCSVRGTDKLTLDKIANFSKGQKVMVQGIINDTVLGGLLLKDCKFAGR